MGKNRSVVTVSYACDPPNTSKARVLVERNLREMQTKPVTAEELLQAKTLLVRRHTALRIKHAWYCRRIVWIAH